MGVCPCFRHNMVGSAYRLLEYDGANLISEYSSQGNMEHRYVHGPGLDAPLVHYDCSSASGGTLNCSTGYDRRFLVADERGSAIAETDNSGNVISQNTYDEYGVPGSANSGRFGYAGRPYLYVSGLYDNRARAYNPRLGRFMQSDPIGQAGGINIYRYASNDPINRIDPWGLSDEPEDVVTAISPWLARLLEQCSQPGAICGPERIRRLFDQLTAERTNRLIEAMAREAAALPGAIAEGVCNAIADGPVAGGSIQAVLVMGQNGGRVDVGAGFEPGTGDVFLSGDAGFDFNPFDPSGDVAGLQAGVGVGPNGYSSREALEGTSLVTDVDIGAFSGTITSNNFPGDVPTDITGGGASWLGAGAGSSQVRVVGDTVTIFSIGSCGE